MVTLTSGNMNVLKTSLGMEATHRSLLKEDKVKAPMNSGSHWVKHLHQNAIHMQQSTDHFQSILKETHSRRSCSMST